MELTQNPFFILGATPRDDRQRILDLAEEKGLLLDEGLVRDASATLTNPKRRVSAEMAWLPGVERERASEALSVLETKAMDVRAHSDLPPLAQANLLADGLLRAVEQLDLEEVAQWIVELANVHEGVDAESALFLLNEDRVAAGFPEVTDTEGVETELQSRRQHYRRAIRDALDVLPATSLVSVVTKVVERATNHGRSHAPILIDDLVDNSFEVEAQDFLGKETENIRTLIARIRDTAESEKDEASINNLVEGFEKVVQNWDTVAQPIQLSARSRGLDHPLSNEVAGEIRGLAVDLFNEYDLLDVSKRLTKLQQKVFAEIDRVVEQSEEDASALEEIAERRTEMLEEMESQSESWRQEITFEVDLGTIFSKKLRISPEGVEWKGRRIPLESISRVRWGGIRHSVNFVPTGTTYHVFCGSQSEGMDIELSDEWKFTKFIGCLWRAVGVRLLTEMLEGLRDGQKYRFGTALVSDYGVELERKKVMARKEIVPCGWSDLVIGNGAGTFYIAKKDERKVAVHLSYHETDNVHVLEAAMRVFWKNASPRLSDLLTA